MTVNICDPVLILFPKAYCQGSMSLGVSLILHSNPHFRMAHRARLITRKEDGRKKKL